MSLKTQLICLIICQLSSRSCSLCQLLSTQLLSLSQKKMDQRPTLVSSSSWTDPQSTIKIQERNMKSLKKSHSHQPERGCLLSPTKTKMKLFSC